MSKKLTIGLFGFGCVGQGLHEVLHESGLINTEIKKIVIKHASKERSISKEFFSTDKNDILKDEEINTVIELIDDADAAYEIVTSALSSGKNVVSANKKLIAEHLDELISLARENKVSFIYEAAVCGSIPIIRNLEEYYNNDSLSGIQGICNGTTNFILSKANHGIHYDTSLAEATELGYAESDPTLDVDGFDSKFKLLILIKHAFGLSLEPEDIFNYGIRNLKPDDINYANEKGFRIKLFSRAEKIGDEVIGFVAPHFIKEDHAAFNVNGAFNAVLVDGSFSDTQLFYGKGAGSHPTASAVLSDVSALQYNYKYEYRKSEINNSEFQDDFLIKIYVASSDIESLNSIDLISTEERFISTNYSYKTGWASFKTLSAKNWNKNPNLFFAVLPENIKQCETLTLEEKKEILTTV